MAPPVARRMVGARQEAAAKPTEPVMAIWPKRLNQPEERRGVGGKGGMEIRYKALWGLDLCFYNVAVVRERFRFVLLSNGGP